MPRCKGNCWGVAPACYRRKTSASCPHHLPKPLAISNKNSRWPPPCRACRQEAACTSWAARLAFSVYRVASILASSCSREVLLVETPACCSPRPCQPPGSVGRQCSHPPGPVRWGSCLPMNLQPLLQLLNLSCFETGSSSITVGGHLGPLPFLQAFQVKLVKSHKMKGFKLQVPGWAYALLELPQSCYKIGPDTS